MFEMEQVTEILRGRGYKVTPQRLAVYEVLAATKSHPTADAIYSDLQPTYPTMSLATVYKTLDIFSKVGLVQVLNVGEESFRYDATIDNHPHVCCVRCNRVDDVYAADTSELAAEIEGETGYKVTGRQIYFYGVCPDCQRGNQLLH